MTEAGVIIAIIGFVLGSIQYQLRMRLQDTKESMYRVMAHYSGYGEHMSIYKVKELMEERLKKNLSKDERNEYQRCISEWHGCHKSLHFWGIIFPLGCLGLYVIYRVAVVLIFGL